MSQARTTDRGSRPARSRRLRRAATAFVALVALVALAVWFFRDLPRRRLEGSLSDALVADVRVERLQIESSRHFVLLGVSVRDVAWEPRLDRLTIERIEVHAPLREALAGRYDRLLADGVDVRLAPATRAALPAPAATTTVRQVEIRRGRLTVASARGESTGAFGASLTDWGGEPSGHAFLEAPRLELAPLLDVMTKPGQPPVGESLPGFSPADTAAEDVRIDFDLGQGPLTWRLDVGGSRLRVVYGGREVLLTQPLLEATNVGVEGDEGDEVRLKFRSDVPGIETSALDAVLDPATMALRSGRLELNGMQFAELFEGGATLPAGWSVAGRGDVSVHTDDGVLFAFAFDADLTRVQLATEQGRLRGDRGRARATGSWDGSVASVDPHPLVFEVDATFDELQVAAGPTELRAGAARLAGGGRLDTTLSGPIRARVTLPAGGGRYEARPLPADLFPLDAEFDGHLSGGGTGLDGSAELRSPVAGRLSVRGRMDQDGGGPRAHWNWRWSDAPDLPALLATAAGLGLTPLPAGIELRGRPTASGTFLGPLTDPAVRADVTVEGLELASTADPPAPGLGGFSLAQGRAGAEVSRATGDGGGIRIAELAIQGQVSHVPGAGIPATPWSSALVVTAAAQADVSLGSLRLDATRIDLEDLGNLQITGRVEPDRSVLLTARIEPVALTRLRELSRQWLRDAPLPDYAVKGDVAAQFEVRRDPGGPWLAQGDVDLSGGGLGSSDGTRVVEGIDANAEVVLTSRIDGGVDAEATADLNGPVLLWGTLFGDFSSLPSEISLRARRDDGRWESSADWKLPHQVAVGFGLTATPAGGPASGTGTDRAGDPEARVVDYSVSVDLPDLNAFLEHYVRGPFAGSVQHIDTLGAAGQLRLDLAGTLDRTESSVEGALRALDASFSGIKGATRVEGLSLDLPIALLWRTEPDGSRSLVPTAERSGAVSFESLRLGGLDFPPLDTRLVVASDTIRLDRSLRLQVFEGDVRLEGVALADWTRPERDLRFGLHVDGLSLAALTQALNTFPLDGSLSGEFSAVRLTPEHLQVDGGGSVEIFGGRISVYDISGEEVLSRFPKLRFSARLDGLHLLDLTRLIDFGEVYGVVSGEIRDCELFGGVPVRCEATLASVKTKGVPQKISVKAIKNISILGSGPRVGLLDRGLQKFFDTYTYSRLGLTMELNHDRFLLRGTERRGTRELFVKGRLPFRIDIVNAAPGQTVSFQTMVQRLGNVQIGAPEAEAPKEPDGGP